MKKIDKILSQVAKTHNLEGAFFKYKTLQHWQKAAAVFLEEAETLTQAIDFKKGVLTVACLSREIASKIKMLAERIIESLNQLLGRRIVYAIYLEV